MFHPVAFIYAFLVTHDFVHIVFQYLCIKQFSSNLLYGQSAFTDTDQYAGH